MSFKKTVKKTEAITNDVQSADISNFLEQVKAQTLGREVQNTDTPPLLSIVVIYDEYGEKTWLKSFTEKLPRFTDDKQGIVEVVLCKTVRKENEQEGVSLQKPVVANGVVYHKCTYQYQEWSYAAARNAAKQVAKGEWILSLDIDEWMLPSQIVPMLEIIESSPRRTGAIRTTIFSHVANGSSYMREAIPGTRLFRNMPEIVWESRIHEVVDFSIEREGWQIADSTLTIFHQGYEVEGNIVGKLKRNLEMLCAEYANPTHELTKLHAERYLVTTCIELKRLSESR